MIDRRHFLGAGGAATLGGMLSGLGSISQAAGEDFRALVVVYLNGGCDGNNLLIPTDGAYGDYSTARQTLALPRSSLVSLPGTAIGHSFALHAALAPLVPLYEQGRLALIANVGPLVEPATARQVLSAAVDVPPFLMSHSDQVATVQGWTVTDVLSGWGGRTLELLPSNLRHGLSAITMDTNRTLVLGKHSPVSFMPAGGASWWGMADLKQPQTFGAQSLARMAQWQFANAYEAEYARTFGLAFSDQTSLVQAFQKAKAPAADFGSDSLGKDLASVASVLPVFKADGLKRQVFLRHWGGFDTHTGQLGTDPKSQDAQFAVLAKALAAFDATNKANGLDGNVVTLVMTEFGRTLRPGSGGGSEHAWGNHWFAFGGPVAGGTVIGKFPTLTLGGPDDGDNGKNGRWVPTTAADQVAASLTQWLGLPANLVQEVYPNLVHFNQKTIALLRA